jgi:type II secretory pathway pseudopilin PulG
MCILNSCRGKNGVTFVETLFSAVILALVVACVLVIFVKTIDVSKRIDKEYIATNLAKNRLERSRSVKVTSGFSALTDLNETDTVLDADGVPDANGEYKRSTTVTANYNGSANLVKIEAAVVYKYSDVWKSSIPVTMTAVLTDLD